MKKVVFGAFFEKSDTPICDAQVAAALKFPIAEVCPYLSADITELRERQLLFGDLLSSEALFSLLESIAGELDDLSALAKTLGSFADKDTEALFYTLRELTVFTHLIELITAGWDRSGIPTLRSSRLAAFFDTAVEIATDEDFIALRRWLEGLDDSVRNMHSVTVGINLNAALQVQEIGLVSFNESPYVGSTMLHRALGRKQPGEKFRCIAAIGVKEAAGNWGITEKNAVAIDRALYGAMNDAVRGLLRKLHRHITVEIREALLSLAALAPEIAFLCRCLRYLQALRRAGMPLVFPAIGDRCVIERLYNPLLLEVCRAGDIVPSDLRFDRERVYILTGPNSGGKTVYLTAIGLAQLFCQLGLPVTAVGAEMKLYDTVVTHFIEGTTGAVEGRLANEAARLRESLEKRRGRTLFLLDETFSSTGAYDALFLAEALVKYLAAQGCDALYITHLHELAARFANTGGGVSGVGLLSAKIEGGKRSYRILPYSGEEINSSFARDIIAENGLGFLLGE